MITMPDGTEVELTDELYNQILYSDEYDREFKALCNQTLMEKPVPYVNTFAALLEMTVAENWAIAQINGYESSREAALDASDIDPARCVSETGFGTVKLSAWSGQGMAEVFLDAEATSVTLRLAAFEPVEGWQTICMRVPDGKTPYTSEATAAQRKAVFGGTDP